MPTLPSPNSQAYEATVPSASVDADPFTATANGDVVAVNDAVGAWFCGTSGTTTCCDVVPMAPSSSVTVSVTVYVPAVA